MPITLMRQEDFVREVSLHEYKLYRIAYRLLEDRQAAEDAVQEVFMKLWLNRERFGELRSLEAFAIQMVKNYCFDQFKIDKRQHDLNQNAWKIRSREEAPDSKLERDDMKQIMDQIISRLPLKEKTILQLRSVEEYGVDEIANIMEMEANNVRVILSRVRKKVRKSYLDWKNYGH